MTTNPTAQPEPLKAQELSPHPPKGQSPTIGALAAALAKAQLSMEGAKRDSQNPHLRNRYADLRSCWAACRGPLGENGLSVTQLAETVSPDAVKITSILLHESGEWIRGELVVPCGGNKGVNAAQAMGSAISYGRRYGLMALVGISADDDDGHSASGRTQSPQGNQRPPQQSGRPPQPPQGAPQGQQTAPPQNTGTVPAAMSEAQRKAIFSICGKKKLDAHQAASRILGREVNSLTEISKQDASSVIDGLNRWNVQGQNQNQGDRPPF